MKSITALEAKAGQTIRFRKSGASIVGNVVSTRLDGTRVVLELALDKENIRKLTCGERSVPTTHDWFENFGASDHMVMVSENLGQ